MKRYYCTGRLKGKYLRTINLMKARMRCFHNTASFIRHSVQTCLYGLESTEAPLTGMVCTGVRDSGSLRASQSMIIFRIQS